MTDMTYRSIHVFKDHSRNKVGIDEMSSTICGQKPQPFIRRRNASTRFRSLTVMTTVYKMITFGTHNLQILHNTLCNIRATACQNGAFQ